MIRTGKRASVSGSCSENRTAMPANVGIGTYVVIFVSDNEQRFIDQIKSNIITCGTNLRHVADTYPLLIKEVVDFLFEQFL